MQLAAITPYGGITVMLPVALVITLWLMLTRSRQSAMLWVGIVLFVYGVVGVSKILFKGWGVALDSLGIFVLSGHAMNTCLMLTVGLSLLGRQIHSSLRWPSSAVVAGLMLIALSTTTTKYTAESLLDRIAVKISGGEKAYKQPEWRVPEDPS